MGNELVELVKVDAFSSGKERQSVAKNEGCVVAIGAPAPFRR